MMDHLETQIAAVLDGVSEKDRKRGGVSNREWTRLIKEGLCALGKSLGYRVSAAGCKGADTGEWMFDLMWDGGDDDQFQEMSLAMECEWSTDRDEIFWDFEKLLVAKAKHKLFIYQQGSDGEVKRIAGELSSEASTFRPKLPDERYMLAGWSNELENFIYSVVLA